MQLLDPSVRASIASVCDGLEVKRPEHAITLKNIQENAPAIAQLLLDMPGTSLHPVLRTLVAKVSIFTT